MRIVSFNILSDDYIDFDDRKFVRRWYNDIDPELLRLSNRLPTLLTKLEKLKADVFLLQEVMHEARDAIMERFGSDFSVGPICLHSLDRSNTNHCRTGNMIMVRYQPNYKRVHFGRGALQYGYAYATAKITWRHTQSTLTLFSIHFSDVWKERSEQSNAFITLLDREVKGDLVIGGDFNTHSRVTHAPFQRRFHTSIQFPKGTYLCERPMIDYIYSTIQPKFADVDNEPLEHVGTCYDRTIRDYGSDHYPVIAEI